MSQRRRGIIAVLLAIGFFATLADWFGLFGRGWGWYPRGQEREIIAPEG